MRKKRWKKILIWTAAVIVVLGVGGLFAANYAMDRMIASLANSLEDELLEVPVTEATAPPSEGSDETGNNTPGTNGTNNTNTAEQPTSENNGDDTKGTSSESSTKDGYTAEISTDKAKDVQEKITVGEKAQLASVFLKELSMEDIKALQELASGGLSLEEKKEARTLILERLSPEQYDELIQVAKKYGMSKGKSYEEVSKE